MVHRAVIRRWQQRDNLARHVRVHSRFREVEGAERGDQSPLFVRPATVDCNGTTIMESDGTQQRSFGIGVQHPRTGRRVLLQRGSTGRTAAVLPLVPGIALAASCGVTTAMAGARAAVRALCACFVCAEEICLKRREQAKDRIRRAEVEEKETSRKQSAEGWWKGRTTG